MSEEEIVDAEIVEETPAPQGPIQIAVIGDENNPLAMATYRAFEVPKGVEVLLFEADRLDDAVEAKPNVTFWCEPLGVKKNDSLDDAEFLAAVQKLVRGAGSGICIRSSINMETHDRLLMALQKEVFDAKVIYMPSMTDSESINDILNSPVVVGGNQESLKQHFGVLDTSSWFGLSDVVTGTMQEVIFTKLINSGYELVRQKFFDEAFDAVMDIKGANPMRVARMVRKTMGEFPVPSHVNCNVLYDGRIFAGATDKLTLIESCLEN